jgi:peptide/nickel transport system permease protein
MSIRKKITHVPLSDRIVERIVDIMAFFRPAFNTKIRKLALVVLGVYVFLAIFGPFIAPTGPFELQYTDGSIAAGEPPSLAHPFGTTAFGYSVLSQTLYAFRVSIMVGAGSALAAVFIGMNIGLISAYYGGLIDDIMMAVTDLFYGLPLYPFAIVYVTILGRSDLNVISVIGLLVWRTVARVTRSEALSIKEKEYIKAAKAVGTSDIKIMYWHILPNLIPLIVIYFIFGAIWGIMIEASLSFLGLGDQSTLSWGFMLQAVFNQAALIANWWWTLAPATSLSIFILSLYVVSRGLEENVQIDHT